MTVALETIMPKPASKRAYRGVKLWEELVSKASIITEVDGGTIADYLSNLIDQQTSLERDYAAAVKKLQARTKKDKHTAD